MARFRKVMQGNARQGKARQGKARQGKARTTWRKDYTDCNKDCVKDHTKHYVHDYARIYMKEDNEGRQKEGRTENLNFSILGLSMYDYAAISLKEKLLVRSQYRYSATFQIISSPCTVIEDLSTPPSRMVNTIIFTLF
jgi:hypothetical protein